MMTLILSHLVAALAGATLGGLYLGLLWRAVDVLAHQGRALPFVLLGLTRALVVVAALAAALVLGAAATHIAAALFGFVVVRLAATRAVGSRQAGAPEWK